MCEEVALYLRIGGGGGVLTRVRQQCVSLRPSCGRHLCVCVREREREREGKRGEERERSREWVGKEKKQ